MRFALDCLPRPGYAAPEGGTALGLPLAVGRCPVCGEVMRVERLRCPVCATAVEGRFAASPYAALSAEEAAFLEAFLRARGNLREVERVLGLSYHTVRSRLDGVLATLGFMEPTAPGARAAAGAGTDAAAARRAALEALRRGEIDVSEALARLRPGG
jgi:hypothetical protein